MLAFSLGNSYNVRRYVTALFHGKAGRGDGPHARPDQGCHDEAPGDEVLWRHHYRGRRPGGRRFDEDGPAAVRIPEEDQVRLAVQIAVAGAVISLAVGL